MRGKAGGALHADPTDGMEKAHVDPNIDFTSSSRPPTSGRGIRYTDEPSTVSNDISLYQSE